MTFSIMLLNSLPDDFDNFQIAIRDLVPYPQVLKVKILEEGEATKEQRQERDSKILYGKYSTTSTV